MTPGGRVNVVGTTSRGGRLGAACFAAISWDQEDVQRQERHVVAFIYVSYSCDRGGQQSRAGVKVGVVAGRGHADAGCVRGDPTRTHFIGGYPGIGFPGY